MTYRASPLSIVVLANHGLVAAHDRQTGKVLWRVSLSVSEKGIESVLTLVTRIELVDDKVFVYGATETSQGMLSSTEFVHVALAIDASSGEVIWRQPVHARRELVGAMIVDRELVLLNSQSITVALSASSGELLWKVEHGARGFGMALAVGGQAVQGRQ